MQPAPVETPRRRSFRAVSGALAVGAGIFLSRISGLLRERVFAHYLGSSEAAGAYKAAVRIPNLLQNLFGEGVLSASFIPVYRRLLAEGRDEEAGQVAGAVAGALLLFVGLLTALGMVAAAPLTELIAPGFHGPVRALTVTLVRWMFPGVGFLVLSAFCLGVLNSHRRFFLPYVAPVLWNATIIASLLVFGGPAVSTWLGREDLTLRVALGMVVGSVLQFLIQLPTVLRLERRLRPRLRPLFAPGHPARQVLTGFSPVVVSRGAVQIGAYIDQVLASFLGAQLVAALAYAQTLYLLPISLFGMSISASELTEMSSVLGSDEEVGARLRARLSTSLARMAFYVVPSAVALGLLGDLVAGVVFQSGRFGAGDARTVWFIVAGATVGLLPATQARLTSSTFWALHDTRTPLRYALVRLGVTGGLGWLLSFELRRALGLSTTAGAAMLTLAAGVAGWAEFLLLRRALARRIGRFEVGGRTIAAGLAAALLGAAAARGLVALLPPGHPLAVGLPALAVFGAIYLVVSSALGVDEGRVLWRRVRRRLG